MKRIVAGLVDTFETKGGVSLLIVVSRLKCVVLKSNVDLTTASFIWKDWGGSGCASRVDIESLCFQVL